MSDISSFWVVIEVMGVVRLLGRGYRLKREEGLEVKREE